MNFEKPKDVNKGKFSENPEDLDISVGEQKTNFAVEKVSDNQSGGNKDAEKLAEVRKTLGIADTSQVEQVPIFPEKESAKKRLLERFNALQDNEYGLKVKAGIRAMLGALSERDVDGRSSLEVSYDDYINRQSRDSKTGHIDAIGGPKNPDMREWLEYNSQAVDMLRQMVHDNVVEVGKHITAKEAYDLLK